MRTAILVLSLFACSEDSITLDGSTDVGPKDAAPIDASPMDADPLDADPLDADPIDADPSDADPGPDAGRNCRKIEDDYQALVSMTMCDQPSDCHLVYGQCGVGLGGCYHAVTTTVTQAQLDALGQEYSQRGCTMAVCDCAQPPNTISCDNNQCGF